jgi:hypothetical protein
MNLGKLGGPGGAGDWKDDKPPGYGTQTAAPHAITRS